MLAMSVRVRPCSERLRRSSSGRLTVMVPSSSTTAIGVATVCDRAPLGPFTCTAWPSIVTSTPEGTVTGSRPMRDILGSPPSPDVGEDFPTHALLLSLLVGEQTGRRRQDRDAQAAQHAGQVGGLGVDPQTGLRHAADAGDRALAAGAVLQLDHELLAHLGVLDGPGGDVPLRLEDLGD